jgi:hypothetical protein
MHLMQLSSWWHLRFVWYAADVATIYHHAQDGSNCTMPKSRSSATPAKAPNAQLQQMQAGYFALRN